MQIDNVNPEKGDAIVAIQIDHRICTDLRSLGDDGGRVGEIEIRNIQSIRRVCARRKAGDLVIATTIIEDEDIIAIADQKIVGDTANQDIITAGAGNRRPRYIVNRSAGTGKSTVTVTGLIGKRPGARIGAINTNLQLVITPAVVG